jgi:hypothetical protein
MFGKNRLAIDSVAGATLAFALMLVFVVDRVTKPASSSATPTANTLPGVKEVQIGGPGQKNNNLRLAVTPTARQQDPNNFGRIMLWDDMGKLLTQMGSSYRYRDIQPMEIARQPEVLDQFDVLFLTCHPKEQHNNLRNALQRFVNRGGTLYASDWRFDDVADAFPGFVDRSLVGSGTSQTITADVVDPGLKDYIGPNITLNFELAEWKTAAFSGAGVTTLIKGRYTKQLGPKDMIGVLADAPLLVKFKVGKGTVIFTSFHNEERNAAVEKKLLQYLVFSLVVADIDAEVTASIQEAGFDAQKSNLLSTPKQSSIPKTYQNTKVGALRFSLGFRNAGATLQLTIKSPDGKTHTWKGTSTVTLEVPEAMVGEWEYTVTAVDVPENFPFTVTISRKK